MVYACSTGRASDGTMEPPGLSNENSPMALLLFVFLLMVLALGYANATGTIGDPIRFFVDTTKAFFVGMGRVFIDLVNKLRR